MSDALRRGVVRSIAGQAVEILISEGWLLEVLPELAAVSLAVSGAWSVHNRVLLAASLRASLDAERARDLEAATSAKEDFSLFDELVAEFPENFGFD